MSIEPGAKLWIPCDVRRTVFSDERLVHLETPSGDWDGFLDVRQLRDPIEEGRTAVAATVVEASHGSVSVQLPGQVTRASYVSGPEARFEHLPRV